MFIDKLELRAHELKNQLCIGLDPEPDFILKKLGMSSVVSFNKAVIDATQDLALCYKPQIAHYNGFGLEKDLSQTIEYIHNLNNNLTVILDAKRGDIGSTASHYAKESFERYQADAVTVNPYLGFDSLLPFFNYKDRGVIALARTSNPSADWLQLQPINHQPLYLALAEHLDNQANQDKNLLFVVGATDCTAIKKMRDKFPKKWFLVPGIGTQGGDIKETITHGGDKVIINVTRSILYPKWDGKKDYFEAVRQSALDFYHQISSVGLKAFE
jgi:orotidine-5'-phosphate decarboxylase